MWEATQASSRGDFSVRRILSYVLATIVAAFLWVIFTAPLTHAATDAVWNGAAITYQGNSYTGPTDDTTLKNLNLLPGTKAYTYVDPASTGSAPGTSRQIHVIYFASDVDSSTATGAKYKTYIYQGPSSFSNPSNPIDISISPQTASTGTGTSSCNVDNGLGWIICPITKTLASGMDWVFKTLAGFLAVRPAETGQDTVLYRAWTYMRSIANVAFVAAFLIIIYSQLSNVGLNNYSIKKLLPRLIVAALLVNLSYYICSIAIDMSNILGYSLQDMFIQIRNSLVGPGGNSWSLTSWESLAGFILSGGTAATAGGIVLFTTLSTYGLAGSLFLLLPALVSALMAVLVALVVMAARQAVITLLVIIAPIAFVAYLLPNTEKLFDKWRGMFMTLLVLFPAFSLIFGGSQLAAEAIIQNADSINVVILGMLVQVAPLFITPMLVKLSGSTVARVAGIINNPNKGIIDRTRNWSKDRADDVKAKRLGTEAGRGALLKRNAQRMDHNRRVREGRRKLHESMADNRFTGSLDNKKLYEAQHDVETAKKTIEERLSKDLNVKIQLDASMLNREIKMRVVTDEASLEKARLDRIHEDLRAGKDTSHGAVLSALASGSELTTRNLAISAMATQRAKNTQQIQFAKALIADEALQADAGGIAENGANAALASAIDAMRSDYNKSITEGRAINKQFNLSGKQRQMHALGTEFIAEDANHNKRTFRASDVFTREAAIEDQISGQGTVEEATQIIVESGTSLVDFKTSISAAMVSSGFGAKTIWGGGKTYDDVAQGSIKSQDDITRVAAEAIAKGKISVSDIAKADGYGIQVMAGLMDDIPAARALITNPQLQADFDRYVLELAEKARQTLTGDEKVNVKQNAAEHILKIARLDDPTFTPPRIP